MADRYAVIGNPIGHTKSPMIHLAFARQAGQDIDYVALEAPPGEFDATADAFRAGGGLGLNVTAPFKLDAFAYATEAQKRAKLAGAANALKFEAGRIVADNFDGVGLVRDIQSNLGCPLQGRRVLLLGAGGAGRGAILPLLEQQPAELVLANRTVEKAEALRAQFSRYGALVATGYEALAYEALAQPRFGGFDIIVNATSASLHGELPPVDASVFGAGCLAYEMVYGKGLTPFLRLARGAGVERLADGVGMLVEQAAEAFLWWRGVRPDTGPLIERMTVPLA